MGNLEVFPIGDLLTKVFLNSSLIEFRTFQICSNIPEVYSYIQILTFSSLYTNIFLSERSCSNICRQDPDSNFPYMIVAVGDLFMDMCDKEKKEIEKL